MHQSLKGGRGIDQSHRHNLVLVQAIRGDEGSLLSTLLVHPHLPKATCEIHGGEKRTAPHRVKGGIDARKGEHVLLSDTVETAVIHTHPPSSGLLRYQHHGSTPRTIAGLYDIFLQHLLGVLPHRLPLRFRLPVARSTHRPFVSCVNNMLHQVSSPRLVAEDVAVLSQQIRQLLPLLCRQIAPLFLQLSLEFILLFLAFFLLHRHHRGCSGLSRRLSSPCSGGVQHPYSCHLRLG